MNKKFNQSYLEETNLNPSSFLIHSSDDFIDLLKDLETVIPFSQSSIVGRNKRSMGMDLFPYLSFASK